METSNFIKQENQKVANPNGDKALRAKEIDDDMYGVFVGDLTDEVDEKDLHDFFSQVGNVVKCKIIRNPQTGLSKRYGFVHFRSEELRQKAILELNNCLFRGQPIMVRTQHYKETDKCLVKPGTRPTDVYIGNIPRNLSKQDVLEEVSKWDIPKVKDIRTFRNESGCYCFLCFATEKDAQMSLTLLKDENNPRYLGGRSLLIQGSTSSVRNDLSSEAQMQLMSETVEDRQIKQQVDNMKSALGGPCCPLSERQLVLLEKSQRTLYVRNLHPNTTEKALHDKFSNYGTIRKVIIVTDRETKVPMGYGFIEFVTAEACTQASAQNDCQLDGQQLTLQISRPPRDIHAIITAAGLTDINGTLLLQYRCPPPQQTYYQHPKTGQLFVGALEHAPQYLQQGYVLVQPQMSVPQTVLQPQILVAQNQQFAVQQQHALVQQGVNQGLQNLQQQYLVQPQLLNQQQLLQQQQIQQQLQQQALQQQALQQQALQQQSLLQQQQVQQSHLQNSQLSSQAAQMQAAGQITQGQLQGMLQQSHMLQNQQNGQIAQNTAPGAMTQQQLSSSPATASQTNQQAVLQRALSQAYPGSLLQQVPTSNLVQSAQGTEHLILNQQRFNPY